MINAAIGVLRLLHVEGEPIVQVHIWSHKLNTWVYAVSEKKGTNPQGTYEVTREDVDRMDALVADGWPLDTAIYRTMGVRPVQ